MRIHILTLFPEMFQSLSGSSIVKRALERGLVNLDLVNFRQFAHDRHKTVDDTPYGGGPGMVLKPEPVFEAVEAIKQGMPAAAADRLPVILLTPQGRRFNQAVARELAAWPELALVCGHYEGFDERIRQHLATDEISIGDYVLSGGEMAAMVVIDAVVRLVPGVLGSDESALDESHTCGLLEYPQYTRPTEFRGWMVPEILLSGNHALIARWRREQSLKRTAERRPDMLDAGFRSPSFELRDGEQVAKRGAGDEMHSPGDCAII